MVWYLACLHFTRRTRSGRRPCCTSSLRKCSWTCFPYSYCPTVSLLISVLLLFLSGLPLQEVPNAKKRYTKNQNWEAYSEFLRRTSILYPIPPPIYAPLPTFLKRTLFLELPIYVFKPSEEDEKERRKNTNGDAPRGSDAPLMQSGSNRA